ncbi:hypothetical protein T02_9171 [Trichinella nativa]|uniref:Uncharacterized protein n=1 Tax=Trichinella nativa TaxID=6335 RepID=A0A0V1LN57_9BILA|nr:hypothetical protein T02_9171 [Trichinella nativa]
MSRICELKRCFLFLKQEVVNELQLYWLDFCPGDSFSTVLEKRLLRLCCVNGGRKSFVELELYVASDWNLCCACDPAPVGLVNCHLGY